MGLASKMNSQDHARHAIAASFQGLLVLSSMRLALQMQGTLSCLKHWSRHHRSATWRTRDEAPVVKKRGRGWETRGACSFTSRPRAANSDDVDLTV